jgi:hypothetical protein
VKEQEYLDWLTVWGDQFCEVTREEAGKLVASHQDAYEVFVEAFHKEPTPAALAALSEQELEKLRVACEKVLDRAPISATSLREAISRTLTAWPIRESDDR